MLIFSNLATSLDGKIATTSRVHFPLGTAHDRSLMQKLRRQSDAVLFGASTLRAYRKPCIVGGKAAQGLKSQPTNVVLSSALEGISAQWPFFVQEGFRRILFTGAKTDKKLIARFEKRSEVILLKKPTVRLSTAAHIVRALETRGFRRLLIEGGGNVMWDFVREDLIDEYYVTLTPRLLGGSLAPTLVDGSGFKPPEVVNLKLSRCRKIGDELYLVYKKTGRRG
jgi:5-amino-6-(5-phosphoribosylamino)uracil reductase